MKNNRPQCKDIPDIPILIFLLDLPCFPGSKIKMGGTWFGSDFENSVTHAMPEWVCRRLALAKMGMLIRRGLVDGCACGCRGDFELTEYGRAFLEQSLTDQRVMR